MKFINEEFRILRGVGIVLVVLGHTNSFLSRYIFFFHIPLFYFISGYFLKGNFKTIQEWVLYFYKKFLSLYIPFIKTVIPIIILHNLFYKINYVPNYYTLKNIIFKIFKALLFSNSEILIGPIWFIPSLFLAFCIYMFLDLIIEIKFIVSTIIFILGFLFFNGKSYFEKVLEIVFIVQYYLQLGYFYRKYENKIKFNNYFAVFVFILFVCFSHKIDIIDIANRKYSKIYLFLPVTISGIYLSIYFSKKIIKSKVSICFSKLGDKSYLIMVYHLIGFKILSHFYIILNSLELKKRIEFPIIVDSKIPYIYTLFGLIIPLMIEKILLIKILKKKEIKTDGINNFS